MESKNPVFNPGSLEKLRRDQAWVDSSAMTLNGTINKIGILVTLTVASAAWSFTIADQPMGKALCGGAFLVNLILFFTLMFNQRLAPVIAPAYAVAEGLFLGSVAYMFDRQTHGIAVQAFTATFAVLFAMLGLYRFGILRATETVRRVVTVATLGIGLTYLADIAMSFAGTNLPMIHQGTPVGIGFSLVVIGIASLNFILDFDMIERSVAARAPKWMEWYAGFATLVTIVWLYLEILRLLDKRR